MDLKFVPASDFEQQIERRVVLFVRNPEEIGTLGRAAEPAWPNRPSEWFDQKAWIWLHYAVTILLRGELYQAIGISPSSGNRFLDR